ncbi:bifunctional methylenetetrahydrofolate dehydrogenase/methenyltetrahydrofolate cyclohydrolase FolD [Campylobacter pinnipediorum]|uniref:bifunctional methylenetetrahydrofolate dehydrogenase/methenyltetrahydrofolate cyclohydrolase FolD n=1 Tax=Campylobacter pinnipediorum TaxID=1965231 RepID=UPI00084DC036|nr:bifunctional methylenetetrahydrofolate dehydrogenase/methenyltetrahydrofolate cyclohydrolase FolD [Campylobacter pinnipediorum]AQW83363.1 bifunctional 5,10-methylene-tetrahydrofolate dehydrogenase / 5,10-methylene-tetrahydrofolate cyclohydrolase [Campylobacter pinnipediorum subsp. pinnipediorum]AQW84884.1 bifunctional 5,10-methylene-tetrahydrofolate dehydrogenase / 5,10-methylene-tetrahydrofolate cyclohydrolase [Campylobacter pinnipediorum subsp. pinnipediorum]AQW86481.1 bifunctional 5,10-met
MKILDGKISSANAKEQIKHETEVLKNIGVEPALAVILVGENKASQTYVASKEKACIQTGIKSIMHRLPESTTQSELLALINVLNLDDGVDGILVQLPLPKHIDTNTVLENIRCDKDVDGFHAINVGKLASGFKDGFVPCTPLGIMNMLNEYNIDPAGKNAVIIGRSNIVGKPMASLLLNANATITITHSKTKNLKEICKNADIIVAAIGKPNFVTKDMVKDGAIVIDVGINRLDDGSLCGDVDFKNVAEKTSYITPVPGGVGPMTIAMLLKNTIKSTQNRAKKLGLV